MHCFSFDIETVPDVEFGRRLFELDGIEDEDVAELCAEALAYRATL